MVLLLIKIDKSQKAFMFFGDREILHKIDSIFICKKKT